MRHIKASTATTDEVLDRGRQGLRAALRPGGRDEDIALIETVADVERSFRLASGTRGEHARRMIESYIDVKFTAKPVMNAANATPPFDGRVTSKEEALRFLSRHLLDEYVATLQ